MAIGLSMAFGGSAESWLQQQAEYDLLRARGAVGDLMVQRGGSCPEGPEWLFDGDVE